LLAAGDPGTETPCPRWGHALVYDAARDEILLFGGAPTRGEYLDDTWTWKDGAWARHESAGPSPRGFVGAAFDADSGRVVLHGGRGPDRVTHSDTWAWDGRSWSPLERRGDWVADHHQIVWDPKSRELVGFGGWTGSGVSGETRVWDGGTWNAQRGPGPAPRAAFGMAFDAVREGIVLYGGLWVSGQYADTWFRTGTEWTPLTGPYDDSSLDHQSMAWDAERNELVLFGGKNYRREMSGRTRSFSDATWHERAREGPSARHSSPLTGHAGRATTLLFGGKVYDGDDQLPLGDLWEWDGGEWTALD
jgi:hypothetical protein